MALLTLKLINDPKDPAFAVVEFHGELDKSDIDATDRQIMQLIEQCTKANIIFDLGDLAFINSEGIGFLVSMHMRLIKKNQQLIVGNARPNVAEVFELVGLPKIITVVASMKEALAIIPKT